MVQWHWSSIYLMYAQWFAKLVVTVQEIAALWSISSFSCRASISGRPTLTVEQIETISVEPLTTNSQIAVYSDSINELPGQH